MIALLTRLIRDESGATAVEYGVLAAFVSIAAIASLQALGNAEVNLYQGLIASLFNAESAALESANGGGDGGVSPGP